MRTVRQIADLAVLVLATARLVRLFTEDHLGRWYFRGPVEAWGDRHEKASIAQTSAAIEAGLAAGTPVDEMIAALEEYDAAAAWTWQKRLSEGASCRWCVGFWLGGLALALDALTRTTAFGWARPLYRFGLAALALNTVANWVGEKTGTLP